MLSLRHFGGWFNETIRDLKKTRRVRHIIHHKCGERFGNIQWNICPLFGRGINIQALCVQSQNKTVPVRLRNDRDSHITWPEGGGDEASKTVQNNCIVRIEQNLMAVRGFRYWGGGELVAF